MWESQVLLKDGQMVFPGVLWFSPAFDERLSRYKLNILESAVKQKKKIVRQTKKWGLGLGGEALQHFVDLSQVEC